MTKAQTPTAAWHAVIESLEREKVLKIADLKKSIQLAIEKEKDEAKATSSPSILDPILTKSTISREKHLAEENTRQSAVEKIQKEVQSGKRRVLVLADMGNGNARHISGATLPVLMQGFSKCMNGEKFGFVDCSQCDVTMTSAKNLNNHVGGRLPCGTPVCLGYREAEAAVEAGEMTEKHLAVRHYQRIQSMKKSGKGETESPDVVKVMTCSGKNAAMCSKFVYLGSMLTTGATAQSEIRRRAAIA